MTHAAGHLPLSALLELAGVAPLEITGPDDMVVRSLSLRAQQCASGGMFIATIGTQFDSHLLISEAVERGATAVVVERPIPAYPGVTIVRVESTRAAAGRIALAFWGNPQDKLKIAATTGTNGKSTTAAMIRRILEVNGIRCATLGTLGMHWDRGSIPMEMTTPDPLTLAAFLGQLAKDGVTHLSMEASSHAIDQNRIAGLGVHAGVFTNLTQDHLDYHGTFEAYAAAKQRLFSDYVAATPGGVAVFNVDDSVGEDFFHQHDGPKTGYSSTHHPKATLLAEFPRVEATGISFTLTERGGESVAVECPLTGSFNIDNALAAAGAARAFGLSIGQIAQGLSSMTPVPGRFERLDAGQPFQVIVDYAHTPDALAQVLRTARQQTAGRLVTVFGCGGDRDRSKRPMMGEAVAEFSDLAVLTSDNPRNEDPEQIAADVIPGLARAGMKPSRYTVILDRALAIEHALHIASPGDLVLIAGKGHETSQELRGMRQHFDDREAARAVLLAMGWDPVSVPVPSTPVPTAKSAGNGGKG